MRDGSQHLDGLHKVNDSQRGWWIITGSMARIRIMDYNCVMARMAPMDYKGILTRNRIMDYKDHMARIARLDCISPLTRRNFMGYIADMARNYIMDYICVVARI